MKYKLFLKFQIYNHDLICNTYFYPELEQLIEV